MKSHRPLYSGMIQALPIVSGYVPVAVAFGVIGLQAGITPIGILALSLLVYSGAAQFLFVGLVAGGASPLLAAGIALGINLRHVAYGPAIAASLPRHPVLPFLSHLLTDESFALASSRLEQHHEGERLRWFSGVALAAWASWVGGTLTGVLAGHWLMMQWPLLDRVLPFALPALFITLLLPRMNTRHWALAISISVFSGVIMAMAGWPNVGILLAAGCGALYFWLNHHRSMSR
ncbi:AzlC family ABC transporter permease [Larsenimonas rhizosphaerae]|uniref:AzlC family ABC transporter permease n=1 Tax=Larsenimonas rhizosphaerae TaxID=2944682 RepID=A0AA41ZL31_9GAMM|nr:AzlC family ABC transporter permease [Larsenimonas rhizosphaerae]MCM2129396.1 AzlC family ABC transporter permease [Larsenimonas rhizosphaerae]MCX2524051.1 AzlC family ABC transporter permease [Larsenimonas rhizosphaerae]